MTVSTTLPPAQADGTLAESGFARLIASGLLCQGRAAIAKHLCQGPGNHALWARLGDMCRGTGALTETATHYARAAAVGGTVGEAEETRALAALAAGYPEAAAALPNGRAAPFLIRRNPLPAETIKALLRVRDANGGRNASPALMGVNSRYNPAIRDALTFRVPASIRTEVLRGCAPLAEDAARRLFAEPVAIPDSRMALLDYGNGGGYRRHIDVGAPGSLLGRRVLSVVLYLDIPESSHNGGDLLLYDRRGNAMTRVRPRTGMAAAFPAETIHEVTRFTATANACALHRTTLTIWYMHAGAD